jgi:outer membrane protein OmpA-like peptidoglycan-associated protein
VPPIVHDVLQSPGQPLDAAMRAEMEPRFHHDFSRVRVHADARAAESARHVSARAYTVGSQIVFGAGEYPLRAEDGRKLLAHELTHVVQQRGGESRTSQPLQLGAADSTAEREAERHSTSIGEVPLTSNVAAPVSGPLLQRQPLGGRLGSSEDERALLWESFRNSLTLDDFDSDKATLKPEHLAKLKEYKARFQTLLVRYPDSFISIIGHTDATDTEEHNKTLGQDRADMVKDELTSGDSALPSDIIHSGSLGESSPAVESKGREARNRRVEIIPRLRRFIKLPPPSPPETLPGGGGKSGKSDEPEPGPGPGPSPPGGTTKIPDPKIPRKSWLEDALEKDKVIKELPDWMRKKVIDALKNGDEVLAEKVIDSLPLDNTTKAAVQAVVKSILKMAKGEKFKIPESPPRQPDFGPKPEFPKFPGEVIIPGPTFRW